jgi:alpha-beta hydrolase superfamily lysophospholipase
VAAAAHARRSLVARILRWSVLAIVGCAALIVLIATGWGVRSRSMPELEPWHTRAPHSEFGAGDLDDDTTLASYLEREARVMQEARAIEDDTPGDERSPFNRYSPASPLNARQLATDWNRTYEVSPAEIRGGALLIHGMTDSPYSMRAVARVLEQAGYYGLALRMPGHGTTPAGLAQVSWQDWAAAVRLGARHVRQRIGPDRPLLIVGYSNGGALAVLYALEALADATLPQPQRLVLLSPMIGVTPAAALAPIVSLFSGIPWFNRGAWTDLQPEYNPFKYNSFPANAGYQSYLVTRELDRRILEASSAGTLANFPPVLTFQSIVDSTVVTGAVVDRLYDRLPANGSALVLFDLNRVSPARVFMRADVDGLVANLAGSGTRSYRRTLITNETPSSVAIVERTLAPGSDHVAVEPLGLEWPALVFSLSHVAIPFPIDDPLYGLEPDSREDYGIRLGHLDPRGERGVLLMSMDAVMRISCNPFFPYLETRLRDWVGSLPATAVPASGPPAQQPLRSPEASAGR